MTASKELHDSFNKLLSDTATFALVATIKSESLVPVELLTPASPSASFDDNLALLKPHIRPNEAVYVLLRRQGALVAVTYVPDTAPVRQKMLFASTRLALVRELGSEHFRDSLFATAADELTPEGFRRHDAHAKLENPLTEEERSLGDVKRAEMEAGAGTGTREIHLSKRINMPVEEAALGELGKLSEGAVTVVILVSGLCMCPMTPSLGAPPFSQSPYSGSFMPC